MRLTHLLNNRVVIARKVTVSGMRTAFVTTTAEMAHVYPIDRTKHALGDVEGKFGAIVRFYFEGDTEVEEGDRFRDETSNYYTVINGGVQRRTFGSIDFLQVDTVRA